ncbi:hypothetical protein H2200_006076 [Cladophialophora chaetospira]|uniref:Uncharacterized protein n=1 Tax=Cladophialophora chaetospira TaxID=386627 RepID=A0AA39CI75_9EURO|nr:hypothetical protein H2200_006076 [Cladophialophora chaetospira]
MFQSIAKFSNDNVGVEKTLKLLQSTSQIAANIGYWSPDEAAQWTIAKNQFAFARRFFRLVKWIDCWNNAYTQFEAYSAPSPPQRSTKDEKEQPKRIPPPQSSLHCLLLVSKWSLLGAYLFLEMFTIIDAVTGAWRPWAVSTQIESLKLWFYALSVSVFLDLYEIFFVYSEQPGSTTSLFKHLTDEKKSASKSNGEKTSEEVASKPDSTSLQAAKLRSLYRQLVIDSCDVIIPGAAVGWLSLDPVTVGIAGTISALVGGSDAWARVNA